jgi:hypothetical protein
MDAALQNFLQALGQFVQINADLAATGRNLKATRASCDGIAGQISEQEAAHIEFSAFAPEGRRA